MPQGIEGPSGMENASVPKAGSGDTGLSTTSSSSDLTEQEGKSKESKDELPEDKAMSKMQKGKSGNLADNLEKNDEQSKKKSSLRDKLKTVNAATAAAQTGVQLGKLAHLMLWLQYMGQMAMTVAAHAGSLVWGMLQSAWGAISGFCASAVSAVGSFLSVSASAATLIVTGGASVAGVLIIGGVVAVSGMMGGNRIDDTPDCREEVKELLTTEVVDGSAQRMANAKLTYSVLKQCGLADENIAGVLGNWDAESQIDFTGVEGVIADEMYTIGPRKQAAMDADFDINRCMIDGMLATDWYQMRYHYPGPSHIGIGIGGWTAENNRKLLAWADAVGYEWYTAECQLSNIIAPVANGGYRSDWLLNWEAESNPRDAAYSFARFWEGNTIEAQDRRKDCAEQWFVTMAGWNVDANYANSIISMAGAVASAGTDKNAKKAMDECHGSDMTYDNSTLVQAALSLAWPTSEQAHCNDGTPLYQSLHRQIWPGDGIFQSCDRSVSTLVRWAGVDDDFPRGGCTSYLLPHLLTSPKWQEIHWGGDKSKLQPGDILICPDHVCMYLGKEAIEAKYPGNGGREIYEGSINYSDFSKGYSPYCGYFYNSLSSYHAFRSVYKEPAPKYKHLSASTG